MQTLSSMFIHFLTIERVRVHSSPLLTAVLTHHVLANVSAFDAIGIVTRYPQRPTHQLLHRVRRVVATYPGWKAALILQYDVQGVDDTCKSAQPDFIP